LRGEDGFLAFLGVFVEVHKVLRLREIASRDD
jgi:hypothetical protein